MKTKEEILKSKLPHQFHNGWFGNNPTIEWEKAIEAMEEYASQFRQPDVIKSVCDCKPMEYDVDGIRYFKCRICGEPMK